MNWFFTPLMLKCTHMWHQCQPYANLRFELGWWPMCAGASINLVPVLQSKPVLYASDSLASVSRIFLCNWLQCLKQLVSVCLLSCLSTNWWKRSILCHIGSWLTSTLTIFIMYTVQQPTVSTNFTRSLHDTVILLHRSHLNMTSFHTVKKIDVLNVE